MQYAFSTSNSIPTPYTLDRIRQQPALIKLGLKEQKNSR
jgi:hypothetical protein